MPAGRPSEYCKEKAAEICALLVEGVSLRQITAREDMPDIKTVYRWMGANDEFRQQYARAREDQADTLADEIIDIADDASRDTITEARQDGSMFDKCNTEWISRSRLRVDARKWVAAKLKPKKYGDAVKSDVELNGKLNISWQEPTS